MKKIVLAMIVFFSMTLQASAMNYRTAREQALFLTDKMAYELNLTDDQYEAAFEINLDYLRGIDDDRDFYGLLWRQRNRDLSYILTSWQYRTYLETSYFYRPLYYERGYWHFGIYARYPRRDHFYFGRPRIYISYRGGHDWQSNGGRSWYGGRRYGCYANGQPRLGMRDGYEQGYYRSRDAFDNNRSGRFYSGSRYNDVYNTTSMPRSSQGNSRTWSFDDTPPSSTRFTVRRSSSARDFGNVYYNESPSRTFSKDYPSSRGTDMGSKSSDNDRSAPARFGSPRSFDNNSNNASPRYAGPTRGTDTNRANTSGPRFGGSMASDSNK